MALTILTYPDARLKSVSEPVGSIDPEVREFIAELAQTMDASPGGVGIAAPQTGRFQYIIIVDVSRKPKIEHHGRLILINPEITAWEGLENGREGCMSVPDYTGNVVRAQRIQLSALDETGRQCEYAMCGYEARVVQHELDHLQGLLFLDRLVSRRHDLFARKVYQKVTP
jgi:peptide deformylase